VVLQVHTLVLQVSNPAGGGFKKVRRWLARWLSCLHDGAGWLATTALPFLLSPGSCIMCTHRPAQSLFQDQSPRHAGQQQQPHCLDHERLPSQPHMCSGSWLAAGAERARACC
jgi:hypothetical protein